MRDLLPRLHIKYMMDNCRLICIAMNMALGEWDEDVAVRIAKRELARQPKRTHHLLATAASISHRWSSNQSSML
jgi:hypothetical protein